MSQDHLNQLSSNSASVARESNPMDDPFNLIDLVAPTPAEHNWNSQQLNNSVCTSKSFTEDLADLQLPTADPPSLIRMK